MTRLIAILFLLLIVTAAQSWAASPVVATFAETADTNGTSTVVTMPASISAGDLLGVFCTHNSGNLLTVSAGSNWVIRNEGILSSTVESYSTLYKIAEGSDNLTVASASSASTVCEAIRVTGHAVSDIITHINTASATATSSSPDPPSLTPSHGSQDYLFLAVVWMNNNITFSAFSTNYTEVAQEVSAVGGVTIGLARRALTGTTDDPSVWTAGSSDVWLARTYSIPSSVAAGATVSSGGMNPAILGGF